MVSSRPERWALSALLALLLAGAAAAAEKPPNLILIVADDLGYGDLGCYGQKQIRTPELDRLAGEGLRFTNFYAGCTVCAPSRCVLMTGLHTGHCWIRGNARVPLRPEDRTLPETLRAAGYRTGLFGKWGLGETDSTGSPTKKGFDDFFGYTNQTHAHNYFPTYLWRNDERVPLKNVVPKEGEQGQGQASEKREYSHDLIMDEAFKFVRANRERPFFLCLTPTLPHANNEAGKEGMEISDLGAYAKEAWPPQQQAHAAMISRLDADVGRLIALLKELNLDASTLVLFSSDNGPHAEGGADPKFFASSGELRGIKRSLTEGGIRVPLIARWPGVIQPGVSDFVGGFQDILPTFAELGGAKDLPGKLDGLSFAPTLRGRGEQKPHEDLYWAFYEQGAGRALRRGDWKIVQQPRHTPPRLYDLARDIHEDHDVAAEHPERVRELTARMDAADSPNPTWKFPPPPARK